MDFEKIYKVNETTKKLKESKDFIDEFVDVILEMKQHRFSKSSIYNAFLSAMDLANSTSSVLSRESKNLSFEEVYKMNEARDMSQYIDRLKDIIIEMKQEGIKDDEIDMEFNFAGSVAYDTGDIH